MKRLAFGLWVLSIVSCANSGGPQPLSGAPDHRQTIDLNFVRTSGDRTFWIEYEGKVSGVPRGAKKLRVWLPVPQDSTIQKIRDLAFSRPASLAIEAKYGNRIAYWEVENPGETLEISMSFVCTRREIRADLDLLKTEGVDPSNAFNVFRGADSLVTVDGEVRRLAGEITKGKSGTLEKARAIYDYVVAKMEYNKQEPGWGLGDTRRAVRVCKGNCTDFHALFNSLCRAVGIASGFEIGLYLPYERRKEEKLGGYHCWAFFRVPGKTWVPVDCSEASRNADKREFFFGGHTSNRVTLSTGRDLALEPKQDGEPLNYFLNPYAEADGKPVKTDKTWSFRDLD